MLTLALVSPAMAATVESTCQQGRYKAAISYYKCFQGAVAKSNLNLVLPDPTAIGKCVTKYAATWTKLQAKAAGSGFICDNPRFQDNGATVTDRLTGIDWEKKTNLDSVQNLADPEDADNIYQWSASGSAADGDAYTSFLTKLIVGCFDGQCDWRLPTLAELAAITTPAFPACSGGGPCIDPIFGPTQPAIYLSSTSDVLGPNDVFGVFFDTANIGEGPKSLSSYLRAARGGL